MSKTVHGTLKVSSGRTLSYKALLQLSTKIGGTLPDGRKQISSHAVIPDPVTPHPTDAEKAELHARALDEYAVVGENTFWIHP